MVNQMDCKTAVDNISAYLDKSLDEHELNEFQSHLKACTKCSSELQAFQAIVSEAQTFEPVQAPESLWARIENELDTPRRPFYTIVLNRIKDLKEKVDSLVKIPAPAFKLAGVMAVLIIGVFVGRYFLPVPNGSQLTEEVIPQSPEVQMVANRTNKFVEKSKILFLGFVNADTADVEESNWQTEKKVAQNLVREAAVLKNDLTPYRNERLNVLIEELELILLEIANLEEEYDVENIEMIKTGIDRKALMLKIHLHDLHDKPLLQQKRPAGNVL